MKECFGKIYPDLSRVEYNKVLAGKVFKVRINCTGLMPQSRQLECELKEWEECQSCEHYRSCYDLSNSKLFMQQAMGRIR
jgi:sulfatase maturation enzyme AslB (radical SAM superfamily)